jgi:two-component system, response regulator
VTVRAPLILLVEDDREDVQLTVEALGGSGIAHRVHVVGDGPAALEFLFGQVDAGQRLPVLVLLDIKLPKMSGLEVLERIRADPRTHGMPVIILTTSRSEEDLTRSYELGANSFVRKPVGFPQFAEAIRELGLYWFVVAETPPPTV